MLTLRELQVLYEQGKNITQLLRDERGLEYNTDEIVEIAYDLQTGSYTDAMGPMEQAYADYTSGLVDVLLSLCSPRSILEAGVGEASTFSGVLSRLGGDVASYGFDLSWSRIAYARQWLRNKGISSSTLCTGNLLHIPFADNSIDLVYTSHAIEPNGGNERSILQELFRVSRKFLVLLEPGYEFATEEGKQRMKSHGFCKNLKDTAESLGYDILRHDLFPFSTSNPLNPTAITIIRKQTSEAPPSHVLACPKNKTPLQLFGDTLFSPEALMVYPILDGIPCLRIENGILASKYREIVSVGSNAHQE